MTSVKEFHVERPATNEELGRGTFVFTDDYSVFDWGKMPDSIPEKGRSLCAMGADNFERLEAEGVATHYRGVIADDEVVALGGIEKPPREMAIDLVEVPDLPHEDGAYDYGAFHAAAGANYLIPLEIVFRNFVPVGSSLRSRADPRDVGLETPEWPDSSVELSEPVIEFSTKYEDQDRYLDREEASEIAGRADLDELAALAREVNHVVTERACEVELTHEDGKIECCYVDGEVRVADVIGTFDENRFSYDGQQVSKEVLRQYHKHAQPEWVAAVAAAKEEANTEKRANWRSLCNIDPEPLDENVIATASNLYVAGTNTYIGRELFDAPPLDEAVTAAGTL